MSRCRSGIQARRRLTWKRKRIVATQRTLRTTSHRKSTVASSIVPAHGSHNMMRFVSSPAVPKPATNAANEFPRFLAAIACIGEDTVCREDHAPGC